MREIKCHIFVISSGLWGHSLLRLQWLSLKLEHGQTMNINIQANVVPKITGIIQRAPIILRILIEHQVADRGPVIVEDLCGLLIRFRLTKLLDCRH